MSNVAMESSATKLARSENGSQYDTWKEKLIASISGHRTASLQEHGCSLLEDPTGWLKEYEEVFGEASDSEKAEMQKLKSARRSASMILWSHIMAAIEQDIVNVLQTNDDFIKLKSRNRERDCMALMDLIRNIVTVAVKGDHHYMTYRNVMTLHALRQDPEEGVKEYVARCKHIATLFDVTPPDGILFNQPKLEYASEPATAPGVMHTRSSSSSSSITSLSGPTLPVAYVVMSPKDVRRTKPELGWISGAYLVRVAIFGLNAKWSKAKDDWTESMTDTKGIHTSIPDTMDDLLERLLQLELIRNSSVGNSISVNSNFTRTDYGGQRGGTRPTPQATAVATVASSRIGSKLSDQRVKCFFCGKLGHKSNVCRSRTNQTTGGVPQPVPRGGQVRTANSMFTMESPIQDANDYFSADQYG